MFSDNSNAAFLEIIILFTALLIPMVPKNEVMGYALTSLTVLSLGYLAFLSTNFELPQNVEKPIVLFSPVLLATSFYGVLFWSLKEKFGTPEFLPVWIGYFLIILFFIGLVPEKYADLWQEKCRRVYDQLRREK